MLGLAFDPGYATNHRYYVDYTDKQGNTNVVSLLARGGRTVAGSLSRLLFVRQPYSNHNGGMVAVGPDRALYVGMGDGGSGGGPGESRAEPAVAARQAASDRRPARRPSDVGGARAA